jgi:polyisoprenoid-binding protein YceI
VAPTGAGIPVAPLQVWPILVPFQPSGIPEFRPIRVMQRHVLTQTSEVIVMRNLPIRHGQTRRCLAAAAALAAAVGAGAAASAQSWHIDETHTSIGFKIDAVGFPTTRGRFTRYAGDIFIDFDRPSKSFTRFTVDSDSIDVGSRSYTDFVKSPALLNVAQFPTMSFDSTAVEKLDARTARVTGDLTMLGVTRPLALTVNIETGRQARGPQDKGRAVAFAATGTVKRSDFGMVFGIPMIDDALEITVKTRALTNE